MGDSEKGADLLGIAPYGEAIRVVAEGGVDFVKGFLTRICYPAAEEVGLAFRDQIRLWRLSNLTKITKTADALLASRNDSGPLRAHPRLVSRIVEDGSWTEDDVVQGLWAGLLASSCTLDGKDESNLLFIDLLSQLTSIEVRILQYACTAAQKGISSGGWIFSAPIRVTLEQLESITGISEKHRLDRELDHLNALGLLAPDAGFQTFGLDALANITPRALALHLYVRCQGDMRAPEEYFGFQLKAR
jgi:hypothetical protein